MNQHRNIDEGARGSAKKRYERPRIAFRERIEVMTAICDPSPLGKTDLGLCPSAGPPQS